MIRDNLISCLGIMRWRMRSRPWRNFCAEEKACTKTLWGEGQTGIFGGGIMGWSEVGEVAGGQILIVCMYPEYGVLNFPLVWWVVIEIKRTALVRLCKWLHISVSVSTLGYLFVGGYWRSKGKVVNFIASLKMMSHVIFTALIDSSHAIEAFICQL